MTTSISNPKATISTSLSCERVEQKDPPGMWVEEAHGLLWPGLILWDQPLGRAGQEIQTSE